MRESIENSHVSYDPGTHGHIQVVYPDFERIYADLDGTQPEAEFRKSSKMVTAAEGLHEILNWAWRGGKSKRLNPKSAFRRFLALSASIDASLCDALSFRELGVEHGCTRALLSKHSVEFSKRFGIKFRRSHYGAANMRLAALVSHQKRKHDESTKSNHPTPG